MKIRLFIATLCSTLILWFAPQAGAKTWWINFPWTYTAEMGNHVCMNSEPYSIDYSSGRYTMWNDPLTDWCSTVRRVGFPNGINYSQASGFKFLACYVLDHGGTGSELVDSMQRSATQNGVLTEKQWAAGYLSATGVEIFCPQLLERLMR